ncbi:MAG: hypothetical protein Q4C12_05810 [Clostridia bacterium]|nr:hypothetical protein [Clostridia bacterium]
MYIYPDNLKSKAVMWLWELKDIGILAIGAIISILALTQTGLMLPLAVTAGYGFLTIRLDEMSIMMFIRNAWNYFAGIQQFYEWRYTDE